MASSIRYFDGSVSIVTGAASGIGKALALALGQNSGKVVLCDVQEDLLEEVHFDLASRGITAERVVVDVTSRTCLQTAIERTMSRFGRLDFMFNNAGIVVEGEIFQHSEEDWRRVVDVNLMGVIYGVQLTYPIMKNQGFGHIVNTASLGGLIPVPRVSAYTTTKYAVVGLTRVIRIEGAKYGVRASAICPGQVRTPILDGGKFGRVTNKQDVVDSRGLLEPDELAKIVLKKLKTNKGLIVEPFTAKRAAMINKLLPALYERLARSFLK